MEIPDPKFSIGQIVRNKMPKNIPTTMWLPKNFFDIEGKIVNAKWDVKSNVWRYDCHHVDSEGRQRFSEGVNEEHLVLADDPQIELFTGGERYHGI